MPCHPYAEMFPRMADAEFSDLCQSVARHGVRVPVVTFRGLVVDGRHREAAALAMGKPVPYQEWEGSEEDLLAYVVDLNLNRRSYTPSQRAAIALEMKDRLHEEYKARQLAGLKRGKEKPEARLDTRVQTGGSNSRAEAAAKMKVAPVMVSRAERIRDADPELFEAVKAGEMTIPEAKREIAKRAPQVHEAPPEPTVEEVVGRLAADLVHVVDRYGGHVAPVVRNALAEVRALAARLENLTA